MRGVAESSDPDLEPIAQKVLTGKRLSLSDGLALYQSRDLFTVGELADLVRRHRHGRKAYYNVNRHINYTNYCVLRCKFCSFYRPYPTGERGRARGAGDLGSAGNADQRPTTDGYVLSVEQVAELAAQAAARGATEVHIVGGLHPTLPFSYYTDLCRAIRQRCPGLHIKAFTAVEITHFTRISRPRLSVAEVLLALREAGLDSLPGGGAEIFNQQVRDAAFGAKIGTQQWFEVHRIAHELGIPSNATMLYGHIESIRQRLEHMLKLREHQDESLKTRKAAFQCFVPLPFIPEGSALSHLPGPSGLDDLRTLAVSRLMLDNFPHIKAFWVMLSPHLAQLALSWGADDFDGTVVRYEVTKRQGRGTSRQELTVDQIRQLLCEAGFQPVQRNSLYQELNP